MVKVMKLQTAGEMIVKKWWIRKRQIKMWLTK